MPAVIERRSLPLKIGAELVRSHIKFNQIRSYSVFFVFHA